MVRSGEKGEGLRVGKRRRVKGEKDGRVRDGEG
jgi:hypothetical protein